MVDSRRVKDLKDHSAGLGTLLARETQAHITTKLVEHLNIY